MQQKEIQPLQEVHAPKQGMPPGFLKIILAETEKTSSDLLSDGDQVLHDLAETFMAIVQEVRVTFCSIAVKGWIVPFQDLPHPGDKRMLISLQVDDILKDGPFPGVDLPSKLFFIETINDIHQRFMLVLYTGG